MEYIKNKLMILTVIVLFSCSTSAQKYETRIAKTAYGVTVFAFDKATGEIKYNHTTGGKNPGKWKPFGESIKRNSKSS